MDQNDQAGPLWDMYIKKDRSLWNPDLARSYKFTHFTLRRFMYLNSEIQQNRRRPLDGLGGVKLPRSQ